MADPYRATPAITIGQRWCDPIGNFFAIRDHRILDDGAEQWLCAYEDGGNALWEPASDILQCDPV